MIALRWKAWFLAVLFAASSPSVLALSAGARMDTAAPVKKVEWPVSYNEQTAFTLSEGAGNKTAAERAHVASRALTAAIEAKKAETNTVDALIKDGAATIRVRGFVVAVVYPSDATAAGFPSLSDYSEHLKTVLQAFVPQQRQKVRLQSLFFRIFLSVFFALLGFLIIGQLRQIFDRLDRVLDQKRGRFGPVVFVSETLLTGEAIGGILVIALGVGRVAAYVLTAVATVAGILGQFEPTRNLLVTSLSSGATQVFAGLSNLVGAIPNMLLALLLAIVLQAALRVLSMFLKGISSGRIRWHVIPPERVPVIRVLGSFTIVLVLAPLILGLLFGGFRNPYETVVLTAAAILGLASVPIVAAFAVGATILWQSRIRPGDWIEVGRFHGEISKIGWSEIVVVPLEGGSLSIPMLTLLVHPLHLIHKSPGVRIQMELKPGPSIEQTLQRVKEVLGPELEPRIQINEFSPDKLNVTIFTTALQMQKREDLMSHMAENMVSGELEILHCRFI